MRAFTVVALVSLSLAGPARVEAAPKNATAPQAAGSENRARELKREGDLAMEALRYERAIEVYAGAYAVHPLPELLYNLGRANEALGRFPAALEYLERFHREAPPALLARIPEFTTLLAEVRGKITTLHLRCKVPGARVLVRGSVVGETPLTAPVRLTAGVAEIVVEKDGYVPYRLRLDLRGGAERTLEVALSPKDKLALLGIRTLPRARLTLDGQPLGQSPLETHVAPGTHELDASVEGYDTFSTRVVVKEGEKRQVEYALERRRPLTSRWWFWAGALTLVAIAAGTTAALLTERSPDSGDIQPGQVQKPLTVGGK